MKTNETKLIVVECQIFPVITYIALNQARSIYTHTQCTHTTHNKQHLPHMTDYQIDKRHKCLNKTIAIDL